MDELKQNILRKQIEREKEAAKEKMKRRQYMDACTHYMALSSIFRRAAYLYPADHAENLFSLAASYETLTMKIRDKEKGTDLQRLVDIKEGSLAECLFFPEKPPETWDHIGGLEDAKTKIRDSARTNRVFLLYGPEGSGKKTLARAFAHNKELAFYEISASTLISKYFGDPRKTMDVLFDKVLRTPGAVVFLEGLDIFTREKTSFTENKSMMLYFMAKIEEVQRYREFDTFVFASAAEPWKMDRDIPEHFPNRVYVPLPDAATRALVFKIHLTGADSSGLNMEKLVNRTVGFSGKQISKICYDVLEGMLLEQNPQLEQLNVRTLEQSLSQRPLRDEDFASRLEEEQPHAVPEEDYRLWKNEFGG